MDGGSSKFSIHSICRICLQNLKNENAYDLFCVPGLVKKFCICTSLSVEPQDGYPKNICGVCHTRLNDLHDFQKQCVDSVQKFQEMVAANSFNMDLMEGVGKEDDPNATIDDDERVNFDPLLDQKLELIENEEDVFKMLEQESKEKVEELEEEQNPFDEKNFYSSESSSESENFEEAFGVESADGGAAAATASDSDDDDKPLSMRKEVRRKIKRRISTDDDEEEEEPAPKPEKPKRKRIPAAERHLHRIIECHICHQKFKKQVNYHEHMKCHNDKLPHQCTVETCLKGFTTAYGLRLHVEHCHFETLDAIPCTQEGCTKTFPRPRILRWHLKRVHKIDKEQLEQRSFPCTDCEKVFANPTALNKHMYKHNGKELPYACTICGKRFVINSELKYHMMRHAGIKNFMCPYCGVGKTTRQELNQHINTHTQEKKYKCDHCAHTSTNKQAMSNHIRVVHENIKDFACQFCGKTFGKTNACKMHELRHTGDMPYRCSICNKGFIYAKVLTVHLKTHAKWKREKREVPEDKKRKRKKKTLEDGVTPAVRAKKPPKPKIPKIPRPKIPKVPRQKQPYVLTKAEPDLNMQHPLHSMYSEPVIVRPNPRHVERVDISQLAGTVINPIPSVEVASWPMTHDTSSMVQEFTTMTTQDDAAEFPFTCPDCGQGFNFSGNLKTHHRIVHEGIKDFACRYCERRFGKANALKYHEMIHTGEKPESCPHCEYTCIKPDSLKRHMKVHLEKPDKPEKPEKPPKGRRKAPRTNRAGTPPIPTNVDPVVAMAAREELEAHERKELDAKREAEERRQAIADAAKEQLIIMQKQQEELEKVQY